MNSYNIEGIQLMLRTKSNMHVKITMRNIEEIDRGIASFFNKYDVVNSCAKTDIGALEQHCLHVDMDNLTTNGDMETYLCSYNALN